MRTRDDLRPVDPTAPTAPTAPVDPTDPSFYLAPDEPDVRHDGHGTLLALAVLLGVLLLLVVVVLGG